MKALVLISGGFDSPVSGYLVKKQGIDIIGVHFSSEPITDKREAEKAEKLAKMVGCQKFIVVPFGQLQAEIVKKCQHKLYYVLTKRLMMKIAEQIAKKEDCKYLVTGENLGQVGSQTLENLYSITKAVKIEILRPLITYDKQEIINLAKTIGTYETSCGPEICSLLGPEHPETKSKLKYVQYEEEKIDLDKWITESLNSLKVVVL